MKTTLFALSFAVLATTVYAQAPQPDFSKVEIKTTKISNNFYTLEGQGGTIGVLVGPDGIFMVDSQFAPLSQKIAAAIHQISDKPIRFMVNTHVHGDHTGGNENFAKMGATIFSRDELALSAGSSVARSQRRSRRARSRGRAARGDLRRSGDHPHGWRRRASDSDSPRPHRWRHLGVFPDQRRAHDRRLLPLDPIPEYRPDQWRIVERNDRRARHHHWHGWSPHQDHSRSWAHGGSSGS